MARTASVARPTCYAVTRPVAHRPNFLGGGEFLILIPRFFVLSQHTQHLQPVLLSTSLCHNATMHRLPGGSFCGSCPRPGFSGCGGLRLRVRARQRW